MFIYGIEWYSKFKDVLTQIPAKHDNSGTDSMIMTRNYGICHLSIWFASLK